MPIGVSYMGTKRALANAIADVVSQSPRGPFLDLFSGMCAIGEAVGTSRRLWSNDSQHFASTVAGAFFCSQTSPPDQLTIATLCRGPYNQNMAALKKRFDEELAAERSVLETGKLKSLTTLEANFEDAAMAVPTRNEISRLRRKSDTFPRRLFALIYPGSYFSLAQCAAIDSLVYSVDKLRSDHTITPDVATWLLLAICKVAARVSTSTGHFAQPLTPNPNNFARYVRQRKRSIWLEFLQCAADFAPLGHSEWRRNNWANRGDALALLKKLRGSDRRPRVIYADPPYTNDQYSRYYHIYETILLYDYPKTTGAGRYRDDRFVSRFSLRTQILASLTELIEASAAIGADLILSYPTNGLLPNSRAHIPEIMRLHYKNHRALEFSHSHSTMGASKGAAAAGVTEVVYCARAR